jgi:hypothetical protein
MTTAFTPFKDEARPESSLALGLSRYVGGVPEEPAKTTLLFLHMPKAGGTALAGALGNRFAPEECVSIYYDDDPGDEELNAARYVTGHVTMSIVERLERSPFSITVLRDPIDRALSTYSYFRELDEPRLKRPGLERNDAAVRFAKQHVLEDFIEVAPQLAEHYLGNLQSRMLGGSRLDRNDERLENALAGLHRCDFVGLAERQDESVDWLTRRLGWAKLTPLPLANVTRTRLRREQVSAGAMEALLDLTAVDRDLYAEAVKLYQGRMAAWSGDAEVEDRGAEIEDARLVSDLRFGEPIRGTGWHRRERLSRGPHFCWIGLRARVDLADDRGARSVVVEIEHALDPTALGTLQIKVNGEPLPHSIAESNGGVIASAPLGERLRRDGAAVRVELAVGQTTRPCDIDPGSSDNRELAIAVSRIALSR